MKKKKTLQQMLNVNPNVLLILLNSSFRDTPERYFMIVVVAAVVIMIAPAFALRVEMISQY